MFYLIFLNSAGKIQISNSTNMILDMQGGFSTKERGGVDVKVSLEIQGVPQKYIGSFSFISYTLQGLKIPKLKIEILIQLQIHTSTHMF